MAALRDEPPTLYGTGLKSVDRALRGGVAPGELCVIGARPSHGKTMVGLQYCYHVASTQNTKCLIISEEMTAAALAKRAIQHASNLEERHWRDHWDSVFDEVVAFNDSMQSILLVENCRTSARAYQGIAEAVTHHRVRFVVVDYLQLLRGVGNSRYEQITDCSMTLKAAATEHDIAVVVLAQLSRQVEQEKGHVPKLHHLKDSGQLEQDADVVMFLQWPYQIDKKYEDPNEYRVYLAKNRNRGVHGDGVEYVRFSPSRQVLSEHELEPAQSAF